MLAVEERTTRASIYSRLVDDLTRELVPYRNFQISLKGSDKPPLYKEDGYFVFLDLEPSTLDYELILEANFYQSRTIKQSLPTDVPVEATFPGEDELYVSVTNVEVSENKVLFDPIPFLPTIRAGADVFGQNSFTTRLEESLEGEDVSFAVLEMLNAGDVDPGHILRFIRSRNLVMRPGPYYPFPENFTVVVLKITEDDPIQAPIAAAQVEIEEVNDIAIETVTVGTLDIRKVTIPGPPPTQVILGPTSSTVTRSNDRGDTVFYYPPGTPITRLKLLISKTGYVSDTVTVTLIAQGRTAKVVKLTRT